MAAERKSTLVVALGNTLRGDDGVAWKIAEALERSLRQMGAEVVLAQQLLPEHAELLSRASVAIFLDCSAIAKPGVVSTTPVSQADSLPGIFTHHLDPASLLKLTHDLYGSTPDQSVAITVGGESFELQEQLSKLVAEAVPVAIAAVYALFPVARHLEETPLEN